MPPIRAGKTLVILPPGIGIPPESGLIPIRIDAGGAFGDGSHPTTRLCLTALERHLRPGMTVLDLGTGTGVLAIAAAKLGAAQVRAVDIDHESVRIARENAAANQVADAIIVEEGSLDSVLSERERLTPASLVIANILAHVIVEFFEQGLAETVAPSGLLILSGILRTQTPEIYAALEWHGMKLLAQEQMDEWVCLIARRLT